MAEPFRHWFSDRYGLPGRPGRPAGVSAPPYDTCNLGDHVGDDPQAVAVNRAWLAAAIGDLPIVWMHQVHGREVAVVDGPREPVDGVDALVTTRRGLALAVVVADCVPVVLAAPGVVAVVHAGRRGLQLGVVEAVLARMRALAAATTGSSGPLTAVSARLGASICGRCYEVPAGMRDEVAAVAPAAATRTRSDRPALDLRAGLVQQLSALGVCDLEVDPTCTAESSTHFSHRRDQRTGRTAGLVVLP